MKNREKNIKIMKVIITVLTTSLIVVFYKLLSYDVMKRTDIVDLLFIYSFIAVCVILILCLFLYTLKIRAMGQKEIERITFEDKVTGGFTYDKFKIDAKDILSKNPGSYALVCLNIDRFKYINDLCNYYDTNNILKLVWETIHRQMNNNETFARQTTDQFIILFQYKTIDELKERIDTLHTKLMQNKNSHLKNIELNLSMGIYKISNPSLAIELMADKATFALSSIKPDIFTHYAFYDDNLRNELIRNKEIENRFEAAIQNKEFIVYYQPKFNLDADVFDGAEALVRWLSPEFGLIPPNRFIPLYEKNGSIIELDKYVFHAVCQDLRRWIDAGYDVMPVSINISRLHLFQDDFVENYLNIITAYQIPSELVQLELTETALFDNEDILIKIMDQFRDLGIKVLMDDFGTGYSSINMLKNIHVDILKIDKSLVDDSENNHNAQIILKNIIRLSHELGIHVTAEGVESEEQYVFLKNSECDFIQGYYCSKPVPVAEYEQLLTKRPGSGIAIPKQASYI